MNDEDLKKRTAGWLNALRNGCDVALRAQGAMPEAASHPVLESTLEQGQEATRR